MNATPTATPAMDMARMSLPQKRMLLQSVTSQRVHLYFRGAGEGATARSTRRMADVEVIGIAVDLLGDPDKATGVVVRMYGEDNRLATVPMAAVVGLSKQQWYDNDPRHPEYEAPVMVVRPTGQVRRRGHTSPAAEHQGTE